MKRLLLILGFIALITFANAQNVAISDNDTYTAHSSAMLDVSSVTKGLLVPRMTTTQRNAIVAPETGLLVFDTNDNIFYFYNGTVWINLTLDNDWTVSGSDMYSNVGGNVGIGTTAPTGRLTIQGGGVNSLFFEYGGNFDAHMGLVGYDLEIFSADDMRLRINEQNSAGTFEIIDQYNANSLLKIMNNGNVGIGTTTPGRKLIVKGSTVDDTEAIFAVQNQNGDTVFAVYNEGVRIWVDDDGGTKANGSRGGFAVGGFSPSKAGFTNEYLRVTPDSVRVYIDDDFVGSKATGNRGGFAVGGFSPSKGMATDNYLFVQDDSTRVYVADSLEGFGVENIEAADDQRIMRLNTENYFIGHESGVNTTPGAGWAGKYNTFFGYKAGAGNTDGYKNVFIGYLSGLNNTGGDGNTFLGEESGLYNTDGFWNVFLGQYAGRANTTGNVNIMIGQNSGSSNQTGDGNVCIGENANHQDSDGDENVYVGKRAGMEVNGNYNVMIGSEAGGANYMGAGPSVSNCIFIGRQAGFSPAAGSNNILIGNESDIGASNCILLGNELTSTTSSILKIDESNDVNPLIYGNFSANKLKVNGYLGAQVYPSTALHVERNLNASATPTNHVALIKNTSTGTSPDVLALQVGYTGTATSAINFITFYKGDGTGIGSIEGNGSGGVTYKSGSADFAEYLLKVNSNEQIEENEVVGVYNGKITKNTKGADRVMVITDRPIVLGNDPGEDNIKDYEKVAFLGQVPVIVVGKVSEGDYILASGNEDGTAIAKKKENISVEDISDIIGVAWEKKDNSEKGHVLTSIGIDNYKIPVQKLIEENQEQQEIINSLIERIEKLENK